MLFRPWYYGSYLNRENGRPWNGAVLIWRAYQVYMRRHSSSDRISLGEDWFQERDGRSFLDALSRRRDAGLQSCFEWAGAIGLPFGDAPAFERDSREPVSKLAIRERTWRTLDGYHFVLRLVSFE